jgi:hypothetical protein
MALVELAEEARRTKLQPHEQQTTLQHHQQKNLEHGTKYHPSADPEESSK